jgi:hypothetical protein
MVYLKVNLQTNDGESLFQYFKMYENTVVDKFIEIINNLNNKERPPKTMFNNFCINVGDVKELMEKEYVKLIYSIDSFINENNNGFTFHNRFELEYISQEKLNALHTEFEENLVAFSSRGSLQTSDNNFLREMTQINNACDCLRIEQLLNQVNNSIHCLETLLLKSNIINGDGCYSGHYTSFLRHKNDVKLPLNDDEYSLFTLECEWGELLLGYGTTGKSLYHVFKDNDMELITNTHFNLSPQVSVTSNIMAAFFEVKSNHTNDFEDWLIHNEELLSSRGIDAYSNKNSNGYIKLGKLMYTAEEKDVLTELLNYPNIINYCIVESIDDA